MLLVWQILKELSVFQSQMIVVMDLIMSLQQGNAFIAICQSLGLLWIGFIAPIKAIIVLQAHLQILQLAIAKPAKLGREAIQTRLDAFPATVIRLRLQLLPMRISTIPSALFKKVAK